MNPNATTTTRRLRDQLVTLLGRLVTVEVAITEARDHATALARQAVEDGVDAVFSLGGDGTANEVLQSLAGSTVPLGLLPGGGTNVLARALGLPNDAQQAAAVQLDALLAGESHPLGLGEANGRLFGFQAGYGFDAAIVRRVEQHPRARRRLRQGAFVLLGLREVMTSTDQDAPAIFLEQLDEARHDSGPHMMVVAGNIDPYTYLGPRPFRLTPGAGPTTALELLTVDAMSTTRLLRAVSRAFGPADHAHAPGLTALHDVDSVQLTASRPVPVMVDGDYIGERTKLSLRYRPNAINVLTPGHRTTADGRILPGNLPF